MKKETKKKATIVLSGLGILGVGIYVGKLHSKIKYQEGIIANQRTENARKDFFLEKAHRKSGYDFAKNNN